MADGLKLAQLSTLLAMMGQPGASANPGDAAFVNGLIGSGQSATMAEAQKKAEKKAKKSKGILGTVGTVGSLAAAPFTGGASLSLMPAIAGAGGALDSAMAGDSEGVVSNAMDAGMGYMMHKSMPASSKSNTKAQPKMDVMPDDLARADEIDPSFGAGAKSGPVKSTQGQPDPGYGGTVSAKQLGAPAPAPTATPTPKMEPGGTTLSSLALPALVGLTAYGASNALANRKAASRPVRTEAGGAAQRSGMGNAATKTAAELRRLPEGAKMAARPDGKFNKTPITTAKARELGMSAREIEELRQRGLISDDTKAGVGAGVGAAMAAALIPLLMKGQNA